MQSRISAFYYISNNLRRVGLLIIIFGLFLAMIYSIVMIINAGFSSFAGLLLSQYEKFQVVCLNENKINSLSESESEGAVNSVINALYAQQTNRIVQTIMCDIVQISANTIIGQFEIIPVFLTDAEHVRDFLDYADAELISSNMKMPQNPGEILVGDSYAKNMSYSIGDTISIKKSKEYKIVGIVKSVRPDLDHNKGKCFLAVGINHENAFKGAIVLFADGVRVNKFGEKEGIKYSEDIFKTDPVLNAYYEGAPDMENRLIEYIVDYTTREKTYIEYQTVFRNATNIIRIASTIMIFICLLAVFNLYMKDRHSEWCLYRSIGYSFKSIYFLIVRELLIILGGCLVIGLVAVLGVYALFNKLVAGPLSLTLVLWVPEGVFDSLSILVLFFGVLQVSVFYALQRIETIDAIEDSLM